MGVDMIQNNDLFGYHAKQNKFVYEVNLEFKHNMEIFPDYRIQF